MKRENGNNRLNRINEELKREISNIINYEVTNSNVTGMVSVTSVKISPDLRYAKVKVKYLYKDGKENVIDADGLFAVCLQHEIDHLDGKLYIDYLSKLKQDLIIERVKKLLKRL